MQELISQILKQNPNVSKNAIHKILFSLHGRNKKFGKVGLWKRDGEKFWISERQMTYVINSLIISGFLSISGKVKWTRWFLCNVYKISTENLNSLSSYIRNAATVTTTHISQRIKEFNDSLTSETIRTFLESFWFKRKWSYLIWCMWWEKILFSLQWKRKALYLTRDNSSISLFDSVVLEEWDIFSAARKVSIL